MFIIITGVSGSGKTTLGRTLAQDLGWLFYEGDEFHSVASVEKMRRGEPLTDEDRKPWLDALRKMIENALANDESGVLACSALKRSYRARLRVSDRVVFIHLAAPAHVIQHRLEQRTGHFMNPALLESQLATLEPPCSGITLDASQAPALLVHQIREMLHI